jgi:crotonobetainyl-CoA:carnitine CoA-transferase CaiB-like acyl-CoA transferase
MSRIFEDLLVVDLSTFVTGGFCSLMLANQGAEVVKVERPGAGDDIRHSGPPFIDGESPYYWTVNYGKKSVELDLKSDAGLAALYELAEEADVFLQNFRPGTADRLGVDYETISDLNDDVIYCSISAFGDTGPWSQRPGYDLLIQGISGIMSVTGEEGGDPVKVGLPQTDLITGMWAAFGISSALYRREMTGKGVPESHSGARETESRGEYIDLGMLDSALPWLTKQAGKSFAGEETQRMGTKDPVLAPYQSFRTADGYVNVAALNPKLWEGFCEAIGRDDLLSDDRFAENADRVENMGDLEAEIEATLTDRTTDEWMDAFVDAGIPAGPVQEVDDALHNEQTEARGVMTTIERDGQEIPVIEHPLNYEHADSGFESPPPKLGEHTEAVFAELGVDEDRLDEMREAGAFGGD